mgnify:FL=1
MDKTDTQILLVEDNIAIAKGIIYALDNANFQVTLASTITEALKKIKYNSYALAIIDIMLPDGNGFDLCQIIKENSETKVLFLTAKDEEEDILKGLLLGDEYLTKPFRINELILRIKNLLNKKDHNDIIKYHDLIINLDKKEVTKNNVSLNLTALEYKIFLYFINNQARIITKEKILDLIFNESSHYVNDNTVVVYIKRIRKKVGDDLIKTKKGLGYYVEKDC